VSRRGLERRSNCFLGSVVLATPRPIRLWIAKN
jgi:hypothetical protein